MNNSSEESFSQNALGMDVEVKGNLRFTGELSFDGKLEGELTTEGVVNLGDSAVITGNISVGSVVVRGKVNGTINAKEKIEIKSGTELFGDVRAGKLTIEEGVTFVGRSEVNPNKASPAGLTPTEGNGRELAEAQPGQPNLKAVRLGGS